MSPQVSLWISIHPYTWWKTCKPPTDSRLGWWYRLLHWIKSQEIHQKTKCVYLKCNICKEIKPKLLNELPDNSKLIFHLRTASKNKVKHIYKQKITEKQNILNNLTPVLNFYFLELISPVNGGNIIGGSHI